MGREMFNDIYRFRLLILSRYIDSFMCTNLERFARFSEDLTIRGFQKPIFRNCFFGQIP